MFTFKDFVNNSKKASRVKVNHPFDKEKSINDIIHDDIDIERKKDKQAPITEDEEMYGKHHFDDTISDSYYSKF